jgi:ABC-type transporter Mla MlaB component
VACLLAWQRCARAAGVKLTVTGLPRDLESLATLYGVHGLIPS